MKHTLFEGEAKSITCTSTTGQITILENHRPLLTMLAAGPMKITPVSGEDYYINIAGGFAEVQKNNRIRCIVEE